MIRFRYVIYYTLSEVWDYWRNKQMGTQIDQKMVAVHGSS
jgi:hypothetical protein